MKIYKSWLRKGSRVLDVGCGDGIVTDELARYFSLTVVGCDIDKYLDRDIAYVHMKNKNKLPFKPNSFDTALFTDVLHHTSKDIQEDLVVEAIRVAREKVIIFELKPTIGNHLLDCVVNKIYHPTMETPRTFRDIEDWKKLFRKFPVRIEAIDLPLSFPSPFSHYVFYLTKVSSTKE